MKRVRDNFRRRDESGDTRPKEDSIPESSRALRGRLRDSVRREDPDDPPPKPSPPPPPASAPRGSIREETSDSVRPRLRDSVRREDPDDDSGTTPAPPRSDQPGARRPSSWESEPTTGTRRKSGSPAVRSGRPPVTVDDVGTAAVKLARGAVRESTPKLIASRSTVAKAPIDTRAAFVLSLVDGRNTVDALVDMAGMPEEEVRGILARLARLGLISLP